MTSAAVLVLLVSGRLVGIQASEKCSDPVQPPERLAFVGNPRKNMSKGLPFVFSDYLELLDWTGKVICDDKRGSHPSDPPPPVLQRLQIELSAWLTLCEVYNRSRQKYLRAKIRPAQREAKVPAPLPVRTHRPSTRCRSWSR